MTREPDAFIEQVIALQAAELEEHELELWGHCANYFSNGGDSDKMAEIFMYATMQQAVLEKAKACYGERLNNGWNTGDH